MTRGCLATLASAVAFGAAFACAGSEQNIDEPPPNDLVPAPPLPDAGTASDASDDVPRVSLKGCSDDGFCYAPVPRSIPLIAVSASSVDDAWMLPEGSGALFHWDGASIKQVYDYARTNPPRITFFGIWAQTRDHVWAVASGSDDQIVLVRYGSPPGGGAPGFRELLTERTSTAPMALWGTPSGDELWIATDSSILRVHEEANGAVVEELSPASGEDDPREYAWRGVWGFGPDDVYVAGKVCPERPCSQESQGAIGHYDGTRWSITAVDSAIDLGALRGTPPGAPRQLWYLATRLIPEFPGATSSRTEVVGVDGAGVPGAPLYMLDTDRTPACGAQVGQATGPNGGWFSGGLLLCRWTGKELEPVRTSVEGRQIVESLRGIWAHESDDAWIVGAAVTRPGFPKAGFAARRTAKSAQGGTP